MSYYYRYTMKAGQIQDDIKRGCSFRYYDLHETVRDLVNNSPFVEFEAGYEEIAELDFDEMTDDEILEALEDAEINVRQDSPGSGKWGLAYSGLSAFGEFETAEEAEEAALEWHYGGFDNQEFTHVVILKAEPTGEVDDNDIDTIKVIEIVKVIKK